jgi:hypothetical protein
MATYELRPMSIGEILDGAFVLLGRHFGRLFTVAIICLAVPMALSVYVESAGGLLLHPGLWTAAQVLSVLGYLLVSGATVWIVSETYLGRPATAGGALRFAVGKMWPIFVSGFATTIVIMLACFPPMAAFYVAFSLFAGAGGPAFLGTLLLALVLVALPVIVVAGYAVVVQSVVLEKLPSATSSLGRSWSLTKGHRGKALLLWIVVFALLVALIFGLGLVAGISSAMGGKGAETAATAAMSLVMMLVYPLTSCVFTLLYYDLRVRKEAFDLEVLSRQIGLAPTEA